MSKKMAFKITQKMINAVILVLLIVIASLLIYSNRLLYNAIESEQETINRKSVCEQLGQSFCDASDYLTEEVRTYIVTQDEEHFDNYWNEIYVEQNRNKVIEDLRDMKLGSDITMLLELAKEVSDELVYTEAEAMYLEKCYLHQEIDETLDSYLTNERKKEMSQMSLEAQRMEAISLLFDEEYASKKEIIYTYISEFLMLMNQKLDSDVEKARNTTQKAILISNILQGITVFLVLFIIALIYMSFIRPALYYEKLLQEGREEEMRPKGIAEIYDLGISIRKMYMRMKKAVQIKSDFLAVMSHEIRTPLHSMLGYHFLLDKTDLNEQQRKYVGYLQESTENLMTIVNNILDYSKLNSDKFQVEESEFSIFGMAEELEQSFAHICEEKGLYFKVAVDSDNYEYFRSDYTKIRQILNNLIGNAVKFTRTGGVKVFLNVWERVEGTILAIQVQDSGIGIRTEDKERIFQSFEQADQTITREYGGSGLGLPICRQLAELLGGSISVESTWGSGSLFLVKIPVEIQNDQRKRSREKVQIEWQFPKVKALIVEDNEMNALMQKEILELFSIKADTVLCGIEAVEQAQREQYDLVLMDIRMPDMDGYETTRRILKTEKNRHAVVMALSADTGGEVKKKAGKAGMQEVLTKPIQISVLQEKLNQHYAFGGQRVEVVKLMPDDSILILEENNKLYHDLRVLFVKEHENNFKALIRQVENRDRKELLRLLQILESAAGTIGAYPLQQSMYELAGAVRQKRITWGQLQEECGNLCQRFQSMKAVIEGEESGKMPSGTTGMEDACSSEMFRAADGEDSQETGRWNEVYEEFISMIEENEFDAADLYYKNKNLFVRFLGAENASGIENALERFDYEKVEEYL